MSRSPERINQIVASSVEHPIDVGRITDDIRRIRTDDGTRDGGALLHAASRRLQHGRDNIDDFLELFFAQLKSTTMCIVQRVSFAATAVVRD